MKGMTTCKICGRDFALTAKEHYVAQDPQRFGVIANLANSDTAHGYDAFDCPYCGCQNIMQPRTPMLVESCHCNDDEPDDAGESSIPLELTGCGNCRHYKCLVTKPPCVDCRRNYIDRWEKGGE